MSSKGSTSISLLVTWTYKVLSNLFRHLSSLEFMKAKSGPLKMESATDQIVGAWELLQYTAIDSDGAVSYPLGDDAKGIIIYTGTNYMSVQLMAGKRRSFWDDDMAHATSTEYRAAASGYLAYSGTYSVDEKLKLLNHHVKVSLFPNWIGKTLVRRFAFDNNLLVLEPDKPILINQKLQATKLTWRKV
jgi:hypothetical protein